MYLRDSKENIEDRSFHILVSKINISKSGGLIATGSNICVELVVVIEVLTVN